MAAAHLVDLMGEWKALTLQQPASSACRPPFPGPPASSPFSPAAPLHAAALFQRWGLGCTEDRGGHGAGGPVRGPTRAEDQRSLLPVSTAAVLLSPRSGRFWGVRLWRESTGVSGPQLPPRAAPHAQAET